MAGRKTQPITFRIFIGGVPLEQIPADELEAWKDRAWERVSRDVSEFCSQHPETLDSLRGKDYVTFLPGNHGKNVHAG